MIHSDQPRWLVFMSSLSSRHLMLFDYLFKFSVYVVCFKFPCSFKIWDHILTILHKSLQENSGITSVGFLPEMKFIQLSDFEKI